jgi:NAD(P)-dependent dehydrogenase (short-subunit alcohol dehydrogenase family)
VTGNAAKRTAFVTGASQGIGAATSEALARDGYDVAVSSTDTAKLKPLLEKLKKAGARGIPVELDVRSQASIEQAMAAVTRAFGDLDVLVNNAGIPLKKRALDLAPADWDNVMQVNLAGTFFMSQQMGRHLVKAKRPGCVINIASTHGLVALQERLAYGVAKAGIIHMTRMLAYEWAEHGIRVNAVAPGRVDTPSRAGALADTKHHEAMLARIPLHRFGSSEEVAGAVRYLASPEAAYVTGQTLVLDGGLTSY